MTPSIIISGTVTVNLHLFGKEVRSIANCDKLAAPSQYQIRLTFPSLTSVPSFYNNVPKNTPALSDLIITFSPIYVFIYFTSNDFVFLLVSAL